MILVTAATAPVGRCVVEQLAADGIPVRALTRDPERAGLPPQAEVVQGDLADADSLKSALEGVDAVFLLAASPDIDAEVFAAQAEAAGVRRIVFQSSGAVRDGVAEQPNPVAGFHEGIERALAGSGVEYTFLRLAVESSGALEWSFDVAGQLAAGDVVRGPYADALETPIHPADFAAVIIAALTDDGAHANRVYPVTGPHQLSLGEQVRLIGEALNRPVRYEELGPEAAAAAISPYAPAELLLGTWAQHVGSPAPVADTLRRLTGATGRSPQEWAAHTAGRLTA
ncbi:NAD(P)H-binding protein [Streptomyces sp. TRM66268-LWL]|uniref:NAD(P)H-binding protein n=2 Tax=Streptomyces polyasparticus TaxID=2767826 RepID=A0ABR7SNP6_9ACTN|nr:NAD(P)H-binding protein [Streptomyces polyasparticus]